MASRVLSANVDPIGHQRIFTTLVKFHRPFGIAVVASYHVSWWTVTWLLVSLGCSVHTNPFSRPYPYP